MGPRLKKKKPEKQRGFIELEQKISFSSKDSPSTQF
jgi:hypothetical protein